MASSIIHLQLIVAPMSSGSVVPSSSSSESLDGLKFGQKIYFEDVSVAATQAKPKKGRGGGGGGQAATQSPRCQVEGCKVDLSGAKAYYSRHKVCAFHSKSPTVVVAGLEQRFCQQCSRSHVLTTLTFVYHFLFFFLFYYFISVFAIMGMFWFPFLCLILPYSFYIYVFGFIFLSSFYSILNFLCGFLAVSLTPI